MIHLSPNIIFLRYSRNEASPQQAAGYQTEGHCRGDTTVSPPSSLCKVTSEQAPRNLLIEGLLMVMTLALLVYSVAQRRLRKQLAQNHETVPNQINQPTPSPTLRWIFQLLEGIHRVQVTRQGHVHERIESLTDVQINILRLLGNEVCHLYQISPV